MRPDTLMDPSQQHVDDGTAASAAVALPLLGLFLLMPPLITLFAHGTGFAGVPLIVIYVFGVWAALIVCAGLLAWRLRLRSGSETDAADGPDSPAPDPS